MLLQKREKVRLERESVRERERGKEYKFRRLWRGLATEMSKMGKKSEAIQDIAQNVGYNYKIDTFDFPFIALPHS